MKKLKSYALLIAASITLGALMTVNVAAQNNNMNTGEMKSVQMQPGMTKKHRMTRHRMMMRHRMMRKHRMMKRDRMMKKSDMMKKSG